MKQLQYLCKFNCSSPKLKCSTIIIVQQKIIQFDAICEDYQIDKDKKCDKI